jgi:hypothetical protein
MKAKEKPKLKKISLQNTEKEKPKLKKISLQNTETEKLSSLKSLKGIGSKRFNMEKIESVKSIVSYKEIIKSQENQTFNFKKKKKQIKLKINDSIKQNRMPSINTHQLKSLVTNKSDDELRQEDIRKEIEETYDIGREIECLSQPIDNSSAEQIIKKESLDKYFENQKLFKIYFQNESWKQFGEGIYLFFSFIQTFALVFIIIGLMALPVLALNIKGEKEISSNIQDNIISKTSFGNLKNAKSVNFVRLKKFLSNYLKENIVDQIDVGDVDIMKQNKGIQ